MSFSQWKAVTASQAHETTVKFSVQRGIIRQPTSLQARLRPKHESRRNIQITFRQIHVFQRLRISQVREDHSRLVDAEVLRGPADSRVLLTPGSSLLSDATNTAASQLSLNS